MNVTHLTDNTNHNWLVILNVVIYGIPNHKSNIRKEILNSRCWSMVVGSDVKVHLYSYWVDIFARYLGQECESGHKSTNFICFRLW